MLPDRVSNPGPLTYGSGVLPIALRGPAGNNFMFASLDNKALSKRSLSTLKDKNLLLEEQIHSFEGWPQLRRQNFNPIALRMAKTL